MADKAASLTRRDIATQHSSGLIGREQQADNEAEFYAQAERERLAQDLINDNLADAQPAAVLNATIRAVRRQSMQDRMHTVLVFLGVLAVALFTTRNSHRLRLAAPPVG